MTLTEEDQDELITVKEVKQSFASNPSGTTIHSWMSRGVLAKPRHLVTKKIVLRSIVEGGRCYTTRAWVAEFKNECAAARQR